MSAEDKQPCPNWDDHVFVEVYYGTRCLKCDLFYAFGCEPWVDDEFWFDLGGNNAKEESLISSKESTDVRRN